MILNPSFRASAAVFGSTLVLSFPALWNGYPITFYDTGSYLLAALNGEHFAYRSPSYGFVAAAMHWGTSLWPVVVGQSLLAVFTIWMGLRAFAPHWPAHRVLIPVCALLSVATSLPWYSSMIMPDVYAGMGILALLTLVLAPNPLFRWEKFGLVLVMVIANASHITHVMVSFGLLICLSLAWKFLETPWPWRSWLLALIAVSVGFACIPTMNYYLTGKFHLSRAGSTFLLARLVQDGIAQPYLERHCQSQPTYKICQGLPQLYGYNANAFLWLHGSPFGLMGGWGEAEAEARAIVIGTLQEEPFAHATKGLQAAIKQFFAVRSGDQIEKHLHIPEGQGRNQADLMRQYFPGEFLSYALSPQQFSDIDWIFWNQRHQPAAIFFIAALPLLTFYSLRKNQQALALLLAFTFLALLGNAVVCGVLSAPHDRYQNRVIWAAGVVVLLAALAFYHPRKIEDTQ